MRAFLFFTILFVSSFSYATQQIKEVFIIDGESIGIESNPLETLFTYEEIHLMLDSVGWCSANWRGYKGTWEIKNNVLFLNSLVKGACDKKPPLVDPVLFFGEKKYPIKAIWFNDKIIVRLTENKYLTCKTAKDEDVTIGYEYDGMVYEFSAGDFVYKSKQKN